ncbi:MAG: hypothetical protein ACOCXA_04325 [Planctomycetota bacterium]
MSRSIRSDMLARVDPTFDRQPIWARAGSGAQPQNLLGAAPGRDVAEFTELARALSGHEAANIKVHFELPQRQRIDLLA